MTEPQPPASEAARHPLPAGLLHDLRTPLNQIIGYSELLLEQLQEQGQHGLLPDLQKSHAAGRQLLAIINEHFIPSSLSGTPPEREPIDGERETVDEAAGAIAMDHTGLASGAALGFVLVVDDIEANRDVLSRRLIRQGYTVATAENGRQALEKLRTATFDLVLLDIMMPEMDGYEVLQQVKDDGALRHIPVIMISALSEIDSVVRCIELGAEDYLPKPFNPIMLKARIGACLEKKRAHDREALLFQQLQQNHRRMQELAATLRTQNSEMARWREVQDADLAVARTTQQGIVNSALPELNGWQVESLYSPLIQVGGDVYGWRQLDHGVWLFWLADATGHGVAAALFTTLVALLFNHASSASRTARGILRQVNAEFCSVGRGHCFMTACCAVVEANGRLTFAGAGHPPLLIRRQGGTVETLPSLNMMMGIDPSMAIAETVTTLATGEVALLYTDGLYSLKSGDGERFTLENVTDAFAHNERHADMLPELIASLVKRSNTHAFNDDLAAIAVHRR